MVEDRKLLRNGLIIAAIVIVVRIVLEQIGAPEPVNMVFGVAWLYLIMPVLFGWSIASTHTAGRYKALFKDVFLFALYTRLMVAVTYMLAYLFRWSAPRFAESNGGPVGENISLLRGILLIPVLNAVTWIITATIVGMILGSIVLLLKRRPAAA